MILDDNNSKIDYISKLHDDLLLQILDKLPMEVVVDTFMLSERWKDLWRHKRNVELGYKWVQKTGKPVLPSLLRILSSLRHENIHSINISLRYGISMLSEIQSLMAYVSLKNVEELYIDFNDKNDDSVRWRRRYSFVLIPECKNRPCSSLAKLTLKSLRLETLPSSRFKVLRELFLEQVKLSEDSVEKITSNCPSLALLCLCNCNPTTDLNIIIAANSNLVHLVIREEFIEVSKATNLRIRAANVKTIEFALALPRNRYQMEGTFACSEAIFRLDQMQHHPHARGRSVMFGIKGGFTKKFLGLLEKLVAAEVLTLSSWCIQVLTLEVTNSQRPLIFEAKHLILETGIQRWEFRGIAYLLLGCHKLENLVIIMQAPKEMNFEVMKNTRCIFYTGEPDNFLQRLETVEFKNYTGNYQTWDGDNFNEVHFFGQTSLGRLLIWNLKTYAHNLKKIVFSTEKQKLATDQLGRFGDLSSFVHLYYSQVPFVYGNAN